MVLVRVLYNVSGRLGQPCSDIECCKFFFLFSSGIYVHLLIYMEAFVLQSGKNWELVFCWVKKGERRQPWRGLHDISLPLASGTALFLYVLETALSLDVVDSEYFQSSFRGR